YTTRFRSRGAAAVQAAVVAPRAGDPRAGRGAGATRGLAAGRSVARRRARVAERLARIRDERPLVARRPQRELQDAAGAVVANLAVRRDGAELVERGPPGPHGELADAGGGVRHAGGGLGREALVHVGVTRHHDLRTSLIKRLP